MKKIKFLNIGLAAFILVLMLAGCSKKSDNPVAPGNVVSAEANIILNGAGYNNKSVTLSNGICGYSIPDTATAIYFNGTVGSDSLHLYIIFKGNHSGTVNWDQDDGAIINRYTSTATLTFMGVQQGTTIINSYGAVGSKVEGSISGKLIENSTQAELDISGTFSSVRIPDSQ